MRDEQGRHYGLLDDLANPSQLREFAGWCGGIAILVLSGLLRLPGAAVYAVIREMRTQPAPPARRLHPQAGSCAGEAE